MKPRHIALGAALLVSAGFAVFGDKSPDSNLAEAVERAPRVRALAAGPVAPAATQIIQPAPTVPATAPVASSTTPATLVPMAGSASGSDNLIVRLRPRAELIVDSGDAMGQGDSVFLSQNWTPPPPKPVPPPPLPPPPPPTAPPLPYAYIGKAMSDGKLEVFLARGDKTYIVRNNTVIDGMYRVDVIVPPVLSLTYLPLNQLQQLNIGAND